MFLTSISLSYTFLIIGVISAIFFLYFKFITVASSKDDSRAKRILGDMKDPDTWRSNNNRMAYLSIFWAIVSIGAFIYLKFFFTANLVSIFIPFVYLALIIISTFIFGRSKSKAR